VVVKATPTLSITNLPLDHNYYMASPATKNKITFKIVPTTAQSNAIATGSILVQELFNKKTTKYPTQNLKSGQATVTVAYTAAKSVGIHKLTIKYGGDSNINAATFVVNVLFFNLPPHGQYLISTKAAVVSKKATFYGSHWGSANGFGNSKFQGYVATTGATASGACGVKFNSALSAGVNQTLPAYMAVFIVPKAPKIAAGKVSGTTQKMAIVKLSKAAIGVGSTVQGTVVAVFCPSATLPLFKL